MKSHIKIFYSITTLILIALCAFKSTFLMPYISSAYILFIFAESYYVLQNYDFDNGIPYITTIIKLLNTLVVINMPYIGLVIHLLSHFYLYNHMRSKSRRDTRLKYEYTINNVIPGPFVLKLFASFLNPLFFLVLTIFANLRISQKFQKCKILKYYKYVILADVCALVIITTELHQYACLIYMIMLICFEFIPVATKIDEL